MSYDSLFHGNVDVPNHSQWRIKAESLLVDRDIFHYTTEKKFPLGAIAESRDGRRWRYCEKDGTTDLVKALLVAGCAGTANWQTEAQTNNPSIWVAGDKQVTITMAATAAAHDFIDGYLCTEDGTGQGDMYIVKDNKVGTANATSGYDVLVDLADTGGVRNVIVAASEITITKNMYKDVLVAPTNNVSTIIGVPLIAVPVDCFFWAQTKGPCPITADASETIIVGDLLMPSQATAGAVDVLDSAVDDVPIGVAMAAITATAPETVLVNLTIE